MKEANQCNTDPGAACEDVPASQPVAVLNQAFAQMDIDQKAKCLLDANSGTDNEEDKDNPKRKMLKSWLHRLFRINMTDGRILIGYFVCTDADANVVLRVTTEYTEIGREERMLGLVVIPGRYIVSIEERNDAARFTW